MIQEIKIEQFFDSEVLNIKPGAQNGHQLGL